MTHADDTNPVTGREAGIKALHMFADWLTAHPEVPLPVNVIATYWLTPLDESDEATRYRAILDLAESLGAREYGTSISGAPQFDYVVADNEAHGLEITYRGATWSDESQKAKF